ncbi:MAG: site-specific integrase [Actinomycetota bacterium]|nr:site-specific integrase [Actinomycetota bacterium]
MEAYASHSDEAKRSNVRVDDVEFLRHRLRVEQQVTIVRGKLTTGRLKGGKTGAVPLPETAAAELAEHLRRSRAEAGQLVFTSLEHKALNRNYFDSHIWRPALLAAGVEPRRGSGMRAPALLPSVLIDAGESEKAMAEYLGRADRGFTLRLYAHLFPSWRTAPAGR